MTKTNNDVPAWLWAGLPLVSLAVLWISPLLLTHPQWVKYITSEQMGFIENTSVLYLLIAIVVGASVVVCGRPMGTPMRGLVLVTVLGCVLLAGEEASWGQHWLGYATPAKVAAANRQGEFNLHNLKGNFQEYMTVQARHALNWICLLGGVILPLALQRWRRRPGNTGRFWDWLSPTLVLIPMAAMVPLAKNFAHLVAKGFKPVHHGYADLAFVHPAGEVKEMFFAMFVMAYMLSLHIRLKSARLAAEAQSPPAAGSVPNAA